MRKRHGGTGHGINEVEWNQLLVALLSGHTFRSAARIVGFNEKTVRRFFHEGLPNDPRKPWAHTPLKHVVEQEQAKARAARALIPEPPAPGEETKPLLSEERERIAGVVGGATIPERIAAKKDALDARVNEANMVKLARGNALGLLGAGLALVAPASFLTKAIAEAVQADLQNRRDKKEHVDAVKAMALLRETASLMKTVVETGHKTMEMERLLLGDPSQSGGTVTDAENMTDGDMITNLTNAAKVLAQMKAKGLRVIQGGLGADAATSEASKGTDFNASSSRTTTSAPSSTSSSDPAPIAYEPPDGR